MTDGTKTIVGCLSVKSISKENPLKIMNDKEDNMIIRVISTLGRECRKWVPGMANAEIESLRE